MSAIINACKEDSLTSYLCVPIFGEQQKNCFQEDRDNLLTNSIHYKDYNGKHKIKPTTPPKTSSLRFDCDYRNALCANSDYVKILNLCLEQLPGILHDAICTAFRSEKSLLNDYNKVNIKNKLYTHKLAPKQFLKIKHLDTLLHNLDLSYEYLNEDLKHIAYCQNMAEGLISNNNNSLMTLIESRLKIHQKEHTDILKPFKSKREQQDHLNAMCKKIYSDGQKLSLKQPQCENHLVFEQILEQVSYFKKSSIANLLNKNYAMSQTTMLSIAFYLIALRSMFKIQTPKLSLSVAYTPVQIVPSLALGALNATARVIEFMGKHSKVPTKNLSLPKIKDFITILKFFVQGTIKVMYCAHCGSASLVFADSISKDMLDKDFLYLCHSCETGQKDKFIFIDNVVQYAYNSRVKFYIGTKRRISRNTIANNTKRLNCYNKSCIGALEYMTRHFSSDKNKS